MTDPAPKHRTLDQDETRSFAIYDPRDGRIVALHRVTGLAGVRAPDDQTIERRVLRCAAAEHGRGGAKLRALAVPDAASFRAGMRVDPETGALATIAAEDAAAAPRAGTIPPARL